MFSPRDACVRATVRTGSSGGGPPPASVSRRVASLPGVGLCAETLSLPHHGLDHGGRRPQQLCYVVLLDQTVQDDLP